MPTDGGGMNEYVFSDRRGRKRQKSSSLESRRGGKKRKSGEIFEKKKENSNRGCDETTNERRAHAAREGSAIVFQPRWLTDGRAV